MANLPPSFAAVPRRCLCAGRLAAARPAGASISPGRRPNTSSNAARSARSSSAIVTGSPRSTRLVTPCPRMPQGTMPAKCPESGSTLIAMPWKATQRRTRTPIAAILSSAGLPSGCGGRSGRTTQTPTRPGRRSPRDAEVGQRPDHPLLELPDIGAHVPPAAVEVEHRIGDPLPRPVIGVLAAAPRRVDREPVRARAGRPAAPRCRRYRAADAPAATPARRASPASIASTRASIAATASG